MLPLGQFLHREGWQVEGILLPGFGKQIESLFDQKNRIWVEAVQDSLEDLKRRYPLTLLAGFSLGASISAQAAPKVRPDGLVLLAPFWKLESLLWSTLPVLSLLFPTIQPYRIIRPDFSDAYLQESIRETIPEFDPQDPAVQKRILDFTIPTKIILEVRQAGLQAWRAIPTLNLPILVLQGNQDETVKPHLTRRLAARLPGRPTYRELPAAHDLPDPSRPAWPEVVSSILSFLAEIDPKV